MDENLTPPVPPYQQCVELQCEYCATNCCDEYVSCMYTTPLTVFPTECPLNKW